MSDWNEKAEDYAQAHHVYEHRDTDSNYHGFRMFARGAKWQRSALTGDDIVERVARALNHEGWTDGWCEPDEYDQCERCRAACNRMARVALTAAIGDDDE